MIKKKEREVISIIQQYLYAKFMNIAHLYMINALCCTPIPVQVFKKLFNIFLL